MVYNNKDSTEVMKSFFSGRIKYEAPKPKLVELGDGKGIGHTRGSYSQYVEALREQAIKGNGIIYIGKSVITDKEVFSIPNPTDKFSVGDVPHILITYGNIINGIQLKVVWKDSNDETIVEQYYNIPDPYSVGSDWWDQYSVYFMGPEDLEEGDYRVDIISEEIISREHTIGEKKDNIKTLSASLEFSVVD